MRFRYIEFDSTGEVLTLKSYHPSKQNPLVGVKYLELPKYMIIDSQQVNRKLILIIHSETDKKRKKIILHLNQMSNSGINKINQEINKIICHD